MSRHKRKYDVSDSDAEMEQNWHRNSAHIEWKKSSRYEERSKEPESQHENTMEKLSAKTPSSKAKIETINMKTGGAYIPPARLKLMQEKITDKGSIEYQRLAWEALKKSLTGLTNKINMSNISEVVRELFKENIIRGRGVLARAIMQAQALSPTFTHVYAALVAVINSKFPQISELILKRLIIQFKRGFRRNDKQSCVSSTRFIAHLLNQQVAHEVLVLQILTLLLENPTDDSIEIAIAMLKECGMRLSQLSPKGLRAISSRFLHILHEGELDMRIQNMIEVMFAIMKDKFKDHEAVVKELDLIEEDDKFTHVVSLEDTADAEEILNVFRFDPEYQQNEENYKGIAREVLGEKESGESSSSDSSSDSEEEEDEEESKTEENQILDMTETNLVSLRRNIYLHIQSSLTYEECAHKLLKLELNPGQIVEMCYMILDCCSQQRTYEKFFGLLAQRFCQLNKTYVEPFTDIFKNSYETIHRVETNKLRNVAKFFAHLLYTDAISWMVLSNIKLNEDDTTSSSRIFIKILFQELCEYMGLKKLNDRIKDVTLQEAFDGLFPRDNPRNTRFAINFFTSIGLGGLTDELREHLKMVPKAQPPPINPAMNSLPHDKSSSENEISSSDSDETDDSGESKRHRKNKEKEKKRKKSDKKEKSPNKRKKHVKKHKVVEHHKSHRRDKLKNR